MEINKPIYELGANVNPYIPNPHDVDYCQYMPWDDYMEKMANYRVTPYGREHGHVMFSAYPMLPERPMRIFDYQFHWAKLVEGDPIEFPEFLDKKDEWLLVAKEQVYRMTARGMEAAASRKYWYHVLMGLYIYQNNSYELTDEQIANVRLAHDRQCPVEVMEWAIDQLKDIPLVE